MNLELTDEEAILLAKELTVLIDGARYLLSPRVKTLTAIRDKIRPKPKSEPLPPLKHYEPPRAKRRGR
jgi:hypothetical protein